MFDNVTKTSVIWQFCIVEIAGLVVNYVISNTFVLEIP